MASFQSLDPKLSLQLLGIGASRPQLLWLLCKEARLPLLAAVMAGFGAVISEVGASMMVGGNIRGRTRVLTTATVLETGKGNFDVAIALSLILLALTFAINLFLSRIQQREHLRRGGIERGERFVQQQKLGGQNKRAREARALRLAARKRARRALCQMRDAEAFQPRAETPAAFNHLTGRIVTITPGIASQRITLDCGGFSLVASATGGGFRTRLVPRARSSRS